MRRATPGNGEVTGGSRIGGVDKREIARDLAANGAELARRQVPVLQRQGACFPGLARSARPDLPLPSFIYLPNRVRAIGDRGHGTRTPELPVPRRRCCRIPPGERLGGDEE